MVDYGYGFGCMAGLAIVILIGFALSRVGPWDAHSQYDNTTLGKTAPPTASPHGPIPPTPPGPSENIYTVRVAGGAK